MCACACVWMGSCFGDLPISCELFIVSLRLDAAHWHRRDIVTAELQQSKCSTLLIGRLKQTSELLRVRQLLQYEGLLMCVIFGPQHDSSRRCEFDKNMNMFLILFTPDDSSGRRFFEML